jgi:tight adherence protein B
MPLQYALPAGAAIGVLMLFAGIYALMTSGVSIDERLARYSGGKAAAAQEKKDRPQKRQRADVDMAILTADVEDKRFAMRVARDLARANLTLKVAEYYYIRIGLALGLGLVLGVLRDPVSGVAGLLIGYFLPRFWVGRRIGGRLGAFNKQLPDTIILLSNSLRAGSSFLQSAELVSRESPPPMGEEMGRVVREVNLGLGMEEALQHMVKRIKSEDLDLMVTAIGVQQQVGGNLAEVLDTIAFTIRERVRIKGEVNTLTAQGRMSGYLVAVLPIGIAFMINLISPSFMAPMFEQTIGKILLAVSGVMMLIGFFAIRKITDIKI